MAKKLSPQGYVYGKNPTATNPFWDDSGADTPTVDASDYVKSVAIASKSNADGSTTYTVTVDSVTDSTDGTKSTDIDVPAAITKYLQSLSMTQAMRDNYVDYTITVTNADGSVENHVIAVPSSVAAEIATYTKSAKMSAPVTNQDGSVTYTFSATNHADGVDTDDTQTITIPAPSTDGPETYVKSVTISDATEIENGTRYTIDTVSVTNGVESEATKTIDVPTGSTITDYVKKITKNKNTDTGLTYLIVTDANDATANITIGTLDSVTGTNEVTTTDGISKVSLTEVDADANSDVHDLAYILTEPMAIKSLTQTTADDGTVTTSLNLAGANQSGEAVTSSIAVQTKTETDGSTGVYLVLTNLNETSDKILSIASSTGGGTLTVTQESISLGDYGMQSKSSPLTQYFLILNYTIEATIVETDGSTSTQSWNDKSTFVCTAWPWFFNRYGDGSTPMCGVWAYYDGTTYWSGTLAYGRANGDYYLRMNGGDGTGRRMYYTSDELRLAMYVNTINLS